MAAAGQPKLPKKELELFRSVVNCYETKQYRKGLKNAESILKKFPNHGETLAMKGLIYNCTDRKEEAYELIKLGLKYDLRSHTCWHVYGLIYKSDSNYKEASKCYLNALRIDPNNQNILRDLSWLQIQMRDLNGFMKSRRTILDTKATLRASWVSYAVATFLAGEYSIAQVVIEKYFESVADGTVDKYEESELLLFQNKCFERQGLYEEGIAHLEKHDAEIVDKLATKIKMAEYALRLGRFAEAKEKWLALVLSQTENYRLHCGLQAAYLEVSNQQCDQLFALTRLELPCTTLALSAEQQQTLRELYQSNPKLAASRAVAKIQLSLSSDTAILRPLLEAHLQKCLRDGVPALFHDVCYLIRKQNEFNGQLVQITAPIDFRAHPIAQLAIEIVSGYVGSLKSTGHFGPDGSAESEAPPVLLWTMFLYTHLLECSGQLAEAMAMIDECIAHTPTALDMHVRKARLLKKLGLPVDAATTMDGVRALDLQDRYLNNKATKYFLRADKVQQAMDTIAMFTKHDGDSQQYLYDMQCNWYELELAESYARGHKWGLALKKFYAIQSHFKDYVEDMFDFHNYAQTRKTTLRMYCDALTMQDNIYAHKFFQRAARGSLSILMYLLDNPDDMDGLAHLPVAERRKERAKLKKKKAKDEKEESKAAVAASTDGADEKPAKKVDPDPFGEKILQRNLLQEAANFCNLLASRLKYCDPATLSLVAEVHLRRNKLVQAARAISCGLAQAPHHPELNQALVKLYRRLKGQDGNPAPTLSEPVQAALSSEIASLMNGLDVPTFISQAVDYAVTTNSLVHRIGAARLLFSTSSHKGLSAAKQRAAELVCEEALWTGRAFTIQNVDAAHKFLRIELKNEAAADAFLARALTIFPNASSLQVAEAAVVDATEDADEPAT